MNASPVAAIVRGWVELYTRGMPVELRTARRDEVDDDLWCQHEEADASGRSPRSLGTEMFLRLLLGAPADLSWRLTHARSAAASGPERSSSVGTRILGALAVVGGASWSMAAIAVLVIGSEAWTGIADPVLSVLGLGGGLAFAATTIGLVWRFQDQIGSGAALGGVIAGLGILIGSLGAFAVFPVLPVGSALLAWDLARAGILPRALGNVHAISAAGMLVTLVATVIDYSTTASALFVLLAVPYLLSWIAIGVSLVRGVPQAHEPAASA